MKIKKSLYQGRNGGIYLAIEYRGYTLLSQHQVQSLRLQTGDIDEYDEEKFRAFYGTHPMENILTEEA
jgi:hypothetical protein